MIPPFADDMSIQNRRQLENTIKKLRLLEDRYQSLDSLADKTAARSVSRRSLKKLINQMKEEIARFETRVSVRSGRA